MLRGTAFFAAIALAALVLVPSNAEARRGRGHRPAGASLTRPPGAPDGDAAGAMRAQSARSGERLSVRVRGLDAYHAYDLRTTASGTPLGSLETNRRGAASLRLLLAADAGGTAVEVVDADTGETVLDGECPDTDDSHDFVRRARVELEGAGAHGVLCLRSNATTGSQRIRLKAFLAAGGTYSLFMDDGTGALVEVAVLTAEGDGDDADDDEDGDEAGDDDADDDVQGSDDADDGDDDDQGDEDDDGLDLALFTWAIDTADGTALPFGAASLDDLAGRTFEIRDASGAVILSGEVPVLLDRHDDDDGDEDEDGDHQGEDEGAGQDGA
jgi:hypothetical protein